MIEAVFISDLHLHPDDAGIAARFHAFVEWAALHTRSVYILGDLLHVWPGDDALDAWSRSIAERLAWLASKGISMYFMRGNRDFLVGERFASLAGMTILQEPTVITLHDQRVLLVHGDRYCTKDRAHQWLRRFTRNRIFAGLFLAFPSSVRHKWVNSVRQRSSYKRAKPPECMDVVPEAMLLHMQQHGVTTVVHGHTHKPGLTERNFHGRLYQQLVLSDWDDTPSLLCYDKSTGFYFEQIKGACYD